MAELEKIVTTVDRLQEDVCGLLTTLVQFGYTKEARAMQEKFGELLGIVRSNMETVWPSNEGVAPTDSIQVI